MDLVEDNCKSNTSTLEFYIWNDTHWSVKEMLIAIIFQYECVWTVDLNTPHTLTHWPLIKIAYK